MAASQFLEEKELRRETFIKMLVERLGISPEHEKQCTQDAVKWCMDKFLDHSYLQPQMDAVSLRLAGVAEKLLMQGKQADARSLLKCGQDVIGRRVVLKGLEIWSPNLALNTVDGTAGGGGFHSAAQQRILEEEGGVAAISLLLELSGCNILGFEDRRRVKECIERVPSSYYKSQESNGGADNDDFHDSDIDNTISGNGINNMNQEEEDECYVKDDLRNWMEEVALSDDEEMDSNSRTAGSIEDVTGKDMLTWNNSEIERRNREHHQQKQPKEEEEERNESLSFGTVYHQPDSLAVGALPWWETPFLGLEFGSECPTSIPRKDLIVKCQKTNVNDILFPCQFLGAWIATHPQETSMMQILLESEFVFATLEMLRGVGGQIFCFEDTSDAPNICLTREAQGWTVAHLRVRFRVRV